MKVGRSGPVIAADLNPVLAMLLGRQAINKHHLGGTASLPWM